MPKVYKISHLLHILHCVDNLAKYDIKTVLFAVLCKVRGSINTNESLIFEVKDKSSQWNWLECNRTLDVTVFMKTCCVKEGHWPQVSKVCEETCQCLEQLSRH